MLTGVIPRTMWQSPTQPVTGPPRRARFQRGVVHWEGVDRDRAPVDIPAYLRQMQAAYVRVRGYSLGYGFAVVSDVTHPGDGDAYEVRGTDMNMASNPGKKWNVDGGSPGGNANDWTGSILLIGSSGLRASAKAAATVRRLFSQWHSQAVTAPIRPLPHSTLDYTTCCGPHFTADLVAGVFDPVPVPSPPRPIPGVPDMLRTTAIDRTLLPFRNSDTRVFGGAGVAANVPLRFGLNVEKFPKNTAVVSMNVTVVGARSPGFLTVWTSGVKPSTSVINFGGDRGAYNGSIVVGVDDMHWMMQTTHQAHLVCDISAYWTGRGVRLAS
jgi:hypothetical protein